MQKRALAFVTATFFVACGSSSEVAINGGDTDAGSGAGADVSVGDARSGQPGVDPEGGRASGNGIGNMPPGGSCAVATDCQSLTCVNGACGTACIADGQACTSGAACCGGKCDGGKCTALNGSCKTGGNTCVANGDCCSQLCQGGSCVIGSSFCIQTGDACARATDCCGGICNMATGATLGTCGAPPSGPSFCNGGVDGTVCGDCNDCCSRLCAPFGPTGVKVCQRANGCHIDGDLCRKDSDCCGSKGSMAPGDGNVTCEIADGQTVGICRNPKGCNPEGNVCHYKNYACSISSARNDCCGAPGNSGACQLDALGVPRCHAIDKCVAAGGVCAFTGDCCNGSPCVPDLTGTLRCLTVAPDGGVACSPSGSACTITADCCRGYTCITPLGSVQGTCGVIPPVSYPPAPDGGTADAASPPVYDGGVVTCAQFGQACTTSADCCNSISCTNGICYTPVN